MESFIFAVIFVVTIGSACIVAFSKNLVHSAFALIGCFCGVAGTFILLNATFLGLTQIVVYAGGILVLTIFAVMLTAKIDSESQTNPIVNYKAVVPIVGFLILLMIRLVTHHEADVILGATGYESTTTEIGNQLLQNYLLPFELVSVVLLVALLGAAIISRRRVKK